MTALLDTLITGSVRLGKTHIASGRLPVPAAIREQFAPDAKIAVELVDAFGGSLSLGSFTTRQTGLTLTGITWPEGMREGERVELCATRGDVRRVSVYIDTRPAAEPVPAKPAAEPTVRVLSREIVATAQVHGGTRVIQMTVTSGPEMGPQYDQVTLTAYDSAHPHRSEIMHTFTAAFDGVTRARETARDMLDFDPAHNDGECGCWAGWDTNCGHPSCWGIRTV